MLKIIRITTFNAISVNSNIHVKFWIVVYICVNVKEVRQEIRTDGCLAVIINILKLASIDSQ